MISRKMLILSLFTWCVVFAKDEVEEEQVIKYTRPNEDGMAYFAEPFHSVEEFETRWKSSAAKKDGVDESIAKYDGKWSVSEPKDNPIVGDNGLIFMSEAKHGAISAPLQNSFKFEDKPLVVQYEVRFQKKHECGGAYVKLLADTSNLKFEEFHDKTEYTIMFGPDKCGGDGKLHFIFQHKNPITHKMEEKHAKKPSGEFGNIFDDTKTHLVGLIVRPDNTFEIQVDKVVVNSGSLLKDMEPPINPPKMIDDPDDVKPEDWDEREKITDPDAKKPDDWDEEAPKMIADPNAQKPDGWLDDEPELAPDPAAVKPQDWDEDEDGEWEAPQIPNPKCKAVGCGEWKPPQIKNPEFKGKWSPPLISNPAFKGIWKAKQIENPNFFEDNNPFTMKPIAAVGFELWSMQSEILFDNIIIADDLSLVNQWTLQTWDLKHAKEVKDDPNAAGMLKSFLATMNEKPWLWVVAVLVAVLPLVMIYFLCCSGGKEDKAAVYKKTDEVLPDDESVEGESVQEQDELINEEPDANAGESEKKSSEDDDVASPSIEEVSDSVDEGTDEKKDEDVGKAAEEKEIKPESEAKEPVPKDDTNESPDVAAPIENIPSSDPANKTNADKKEESNIESINDEDSSDISKESDVSEEVNIASEKDASEEKSVPEEIPHSSPKTRAARRKTRKDS